MASNSPSPPDGNDHPAAAAHGVSILADFATPTPEGRARYEQNMRDMVGATSRTDALVKQMRELERFFGPMVPGSDEDEHEYQSRMQSNAIARENDRRCADWNRAIDDAGIDAPDASKQTRQRNLETPGSCVPGQVQRPLHRGWDKQAIAAFLASDRSKAVSKQMAEFYAEDALIEARMRAMLDGDTGARLVGESYPLDPNGGGQGSQYAMADCAPSPPRSRLPEQQQQHARDSTLERLQAHYRDRSMHDITNTSRLAKAMKQHAKDVFGPAGLHAPGKQEKEKETAADEEEEEVPVAVARIHGHDTLPSRATTTGQQQQQQHAGDVRAEKMAHIEQCIKIVGDSTINAFDHVRLGNMITNLETRSLHAMRPAEVSRLRAISASFAGLAIAFATPPKRRGRKQRRTYRRGKPDVRMAPTEVDPAHASDRSRMDAQPRPKKGAWPTFYCKRCPINGRAATPTELPYGTLSRDVLCDTCAVQLHTEPPPMIIHPNGDVDNYDDNAYIQACLPIICDDDGKTRISHAAFHARPVTSTASSRVVQRTLDPMCVALMHADERALAASSRIWDSDTILRDREIRGFVQAMGEKGEGGRAPTSPRPLADADDWMLVDAREQVPVHAMATAAEEEEEANKDGEPLERV